MKLKLDQNYHAPLMNVLRVIKTTKKRVNDLLSIVNVLRGSSPPRPRIGGRLSSMDYLILLRYQTSNMRLDITVPDSDPSLFFRVDIKFQSF